MQAQTARAAQTNRIAEAVQRGQLDRELYKEIE